MKTLISCLIVFLLGTVSFSQSGTTGTVTDIDGNVYKTVKIGDQWWMAENLRVTRYQNGDSIPNVTDDTEWNKMTKGAWCVYDNDDGNKGTYGLLYNWHAVADSRNIAPEGWHVSTDEEWQVLLDYLGGGDVSGGKLKATGTIEGNDGLWASPNEGATNESGFSALPGGWRRYTGNFNYIGNFAVFWSSTEYTSYQAFFWNLFYDNSTVFYYFYFKSYGFSVRCVRDSAATKIESSAPQPINSPKLAQNYPNPFNPTTTIKYQLSSKSTVQIKIYNIYGQLVHELINRESGPGAFQVTWDGKNDDGQTVTSGTYFYRLETEDYVSIKKAIFLK